MPASAFVIAALAGIFLAGPDILWGQSAPMLPGSSGAQSERYRQITKNSSRLDISLQLNRSVYFPGEQARVTITVTNRTAETLEIYEPFRGETNQFWLKILRKTSAEWMPTVPDDRITIGAPTVPTVFIHPTEALELSSDLGSACSKLGALCDIPRAAGDYRLVYEYGGFVEFSVIVPVLEQSILVRMPANRLFLLMVLESGGERFLTISTKPFPENGRGTPLRKGPLNIADIPEFLPYIRIAPLSAAIASLRAMSDAGEGIQVIAEDVRRVETVYHMDVDRSH